MLPTPLRVSIVEDDAGLRASLAALVDAQSHLECVSSHPNAEHAIHLLTRKQPHVALVDINLPKASGIECVRTLKIAQPSLQVIMLTVYDDTQKIFESLKAGATGYLLKRTPSHKIIEAIAEVYQGGAPMSAQIARLVVKSFQPPEQATNPLSPRERQVLELLARGATYKGAAEHLGLSFETVKSYVKSLYERLHVANRQQAVNKLLHPGVEPLPTDKNR